MAERFNFLAKNLHWKNRAKELIYKEHIDPDWNRGKTLLPSLAYHHTEPDITDNPNHQYQDKDYIGRNPNINQCIRQHDVSYRHQQNQNHGSTGIESHQQELMM